MNYKKYKKRVLKHSKNEKLSIYLENLSEDYYAKRLFNLSDKAIKEFKSWRIEALLQLAKTTYKDQLNIRQLKYGIEINFNEMTDDQKQTFQMDLIKMTSFLINNAIKIFDVKGTPEECLLKLGEITASKESVNRELLK